MALFDTNPKTRPQIRFPEFNDDWAQRKLKTIAVKSSEKNKTSSADMVFTNSAVRGVVPQSDFFNKEIAVQGNLANYYKVKLNDFVYNPRISTSAPVGPFKRNHYGDGVMSPLYTIYRFSNTENLDFFEMYFSSSGWHKYMRSVANYGARHDRMAISGSALDNLPLPYPTKPEQAKIATFLKSLDYNIQAQQQKVELLKKYRNGVIQSVFTHKIRFKNSEGNQYEDWKDTNLSELLVKRSLRNKNSVVTEVFSVAKTAGVINQIKHLGRSFASSDISNYKIVEPGDVVYTKSPTSDFPYGIIKQNKLPRRGVVSVLYGVYKPKNKYVGFLLDAYFNSWKNTYNYLNPIVQKGAKNTINIGDEAFLDGASISFSVNENEQRKISNFIESIEKKIDLETAKLNESRTFKKALQQRMFV